MQHRLDRFTANDRKERIEIPLSGTGFKFVKWFVKRLVIQEQRAGEVASSLLLF